MSNTVTLNISIIIFASPYKSSFRFNHISNHIVYKSMLIPDLFLLELFLILLIIYFLKNIFEFSIIFFKNCIFCCQIKWILSLKSKLKATMSKLFNAFISIIHCQSNSTFSLKLINEHSTLFSIFSFKNYFKSSRLINFKICGFVLISKSMSSNNNWFFPTRNQSWNVANYDRLSKNCAI